MWLLPRVADTWENIRPNPTATTHIELKYKIGKSNPCGYKGLPILYFW